MIESVSEPVRIVGIGASAGGLAPIEEFFDNMPVDSGMAFVVVQHLSPDFESMMDELLARHTKMEIHKVVDRIDVKPNAVYLIPAEKNMSLSDGKLLLTDQDKKRALNLPIDIFFDSLAANAGERSAAVVLSGSGSDGSRGVTKIHNAGGVVLVQEPETAAFDSMPKASIRTGICDAVASPAELALKLASFNRTNSKTQLVKEIQATVPNPDDGPESAIFHILRLFRIHFEVDFALYKPATITRRIDRRVQMGGFKTLMAYAEYLEESREELNLLFRDLLVEVTEFFRDEAAFRILRTTVIPNLVENKPDNGEIRVWVPGCATGEEAYSIAMLIDEAISKSGRKIEFRVFATDVHRSSLETASLAVYPANSTTRIPSELSQKYFTQNNDLCHIKRDLRQKVIFAANDLTSDPPFTRIDLISCRNVLIYLESKIQKRIISFFHFGLTVGGTLFLGPSETVGDLAPEFETVDRHWRIYSKRRDIRLPEAARLPVVPAISSLVHDRTAGVASGAKAAMHPWLTSAYEDLLAKHVPPSLLINQFGELLHSFGAARNFLVQPEGRSTLDAIKLLPDSLRTVVSAGLHRAKSDDKPVVFHSVEISEDDDKNHRVTVEPYQKGSESMFLVSIEPEESPKVSVETPVQVQDFDSEAFSNERISQLERELGYTRETLQATVEELETSNEELQSTNEELIASNEELQSTNEELHSVNEELYTVNSEHKQKIEELTELTSDMDNLLKSTDIGTIFLDDEFRIRMFTPAISAAFNVMEQDIGRPIEHIAYKLDSPNLIEDAARVLRTGVPAEVEVQNYHGQCYLQRIQPYRTEFGEIKGIVLTTTNVTAVREAERAERQLDSVAQIQEELPEFAYAVSHDLQAPLRHITHYSRILEEKAESGAIDEVLRASKVISESTANLRTMIEGLLTYSRINTRGGPLLRVQLDDVIADAVLHLGSTISFHDADIDVPEMPVVVGDAEQLEQLFFHVIDNAIKYCDDSTTPEVKLSVTADNRQIHIIVSDNGIGIEERHRERVFTMFKRLGFKETVPGSGIGLAISRRIVVRHGGRIWFTGNDRGGSDCHILLQKYLRPDVDTALPSSGPIANRS